MSPQNQVETRLRQVENQFKSVQLNSVFRSERLFYRGIEDNEEDKAFFDEQIQKDPAGFSLSNGNILRPGRRDASDFFFSDTRDSHLAVYICLPAQLSDTTAGQSEENGQAAIEQKLATKKEKEKSIPIGILTLDASSCDDHRYYHQHRSMSLGINIAPEYQNKGYGGEAINWALDWAFRFAGLHSVSLCTVEYNVRGRHLYEKLGFTLEGRWREDCYHDRRWYDTIFYSMLEHEWEALRGLSTT
jgi:RimJ/RimL family protein N-acetyltransferase